jgi:hypothetical protein
MVLLKVVAVITDFFGNPIQGKTVYFYVSGDGVNWELFAIAATDSGGFVSVEYDANQKTWFMVEFRGDDDYEPVSAVAVWEPCSPVLRTGISFMDNVVFCVGRYGVTVVVLIVALFLLVLLIRR